MFCHIFCVNNVTFVEEVSAIFEDSSHENMVLNSTNYNKKNQVVNIKMNWKSLEHYIMKKFTHIQGLCYVHVFQWPQGGNTQRTPTFPAQFVNRSHYFGKKEGNALEASKKTDSTIHNSFIRFEVSHQSLQEFDSCTTTKAQRQPRNSLAREEVNSHEN